jgi:hypothetical protein
MKIWFSRYGATWLGCAIGAFCGAYFQNLSWMRALLNALLAATLLNLLTYVLVYRRRL